jgi:hypothetical protein
MYNGRMADTDPRISRSETTTPGVGSRRDEERVRFRAEVEAIPLDGRHEAILGTTEDICHRGVFVNSKVRLVVDSLVVLKIHTSEGKLKVTARVVHNIEGVGFGCEFIDLDESQRTFLSLLVSTKAAAPTPIRTIH